MSLTNIHYRVDPGIEGLPEWASYFLFLGFFLSSQPKTDSRSIIGVALPTRAYAAALAATGIVLLVGAFAGIWISVSISRGLGRAGLGRRARVRGKQVDGLHLAWLIGTLSARLEAVAWGPRPS